ncbi:MULTISPECIES: hypothetical protein [Rhodopseudomonas]|uniref:Uncharacterized protein n=1 Tax=Rhodopseudomonas palustris TaxID=1076 RepID=A0A0D7ELY0_RHOPL|nr:MULTISPECIES: hypothetical protein [Rhodopseudomonas]KIZ41671.1 hypothetical protein OO17_14490 [Rhodopseudomonas palustris]MDF3812278.1 hypothetical protein [Rhodopseudomonas sp. BAL398]WOK20252.1 hypothetical protein RBJ75_12340 [Rhodopseudomonas sp. BAL398]
MDTQLFAGHDKRLMAVTAIAVEANALVYDHGCEEVIANDDPDAGRKVFAAAFLAWAEGKIDGTAEEVFAAVQEVLEA